MRLYLQADSKNNVVYIPDWIKVNCNDGDIVFDIQAEICFDNTALNCRCKGYLVPWVLHTEYGEYNLYDDCFQDYVETITDDRIAEFIQAATSFEVGVYPVGNEDLAEQDVLTNCKGLFEYDHISKEFEFVTELNIQE